MFAGNLGAVIAGAPLAWVVTVASWRIGLRRAGRRSRSRSAIATWCRVRDRPEHRGFAAVRRDAPSYGTMPLVRALRQVLANPATWPGFFVNVGIGGSFLAFAGLWAVPYLQRCTACRATSRAARQSPAARRGGRLAGGRLALRPPAQPARRHARVHVAVRAVVAAVAPARAVAAAASCLVLADGTAHPRLHAHLDGREGSQSSRALRHGDVRRQRRHLPRHRASCSRWWAGCSTADARAAMSRTRGTSADGARGQRGVRRAAAWLVRGRATPGTRVR